jgi:glycerophosphoryl diester phosphodiesterase
VTALFEPWPLPLWIAHRGAGKLAPENTLAAFRVGASHGYRAFECDVKLSADGVPFLLHDSTLDRTTPVRGLAGLKDWAELSRTDAGGWHTRAFAGEPIPSLELIARHVQRNGHALNIEIKPTPGQEHATGLAVGRACLHLWDSQAPPAQFPLFSSFRPDALQGALEAAPQIPRALLLDTLWPGWWDAAQALGCVAVVTHYGLMDAALLLRLHGAGLRGLCYTVNDPVEAQRLLRLGVDGLITDAVDRFAPGATGLYD